MLFKYIKVIGIISILASCQDGENESERPNNQGQMAITVDEVVFDLNVINQAMKTSETHAMSALSSYQNPEGFKGADIMLHYDESAVKIEELKNEFDKISNWRILGIPKIQYTRQPKLSYPVQEAKRIITEIFSVWQQGIQLVVNLEALRESMDINSADEGITEEQAETIADMVQAFSSEADQFNRQFEAVGFNLSQYKKEDPAELVEAYDVLFVAMRDGLLNKVAKFRNLIDLESNKLKNNLEKIQDNIQ